MPDLAIALFGRAPSAPDAKTRLRRGLAGSPGATLPACLLRDTAAVVTRVAGADTVVVCTPDDAGAEFRELVPAARHIVPQRGDELGRRMHQAFVDLFSLGYQRVMVIGTDLPTLPAAHLEMAADALAVAGRTRVVLGPAEDGGYYLIGLAGPAPGVFEGVAWSTPHVFAQTVAAAARAGLEVSTVPPWFDVDTRDDLARLAMDLQSLPRDVAPFTREWLRAASPIPRPASGPRSRR